MRAGLLFALACEVLVWSTGCGRTITTDQEAATTIRFGAGTGFAIELVTELTHRLPTFDIQSFSIGEAAGVAAIQAAQLDAMVVTSDAAYLAYRADLERPAKTSRLRAIAALHPAVLHFIVAPDSGVNRVSDLRGRSVWISNQPLPRLVLQASGITEESTRLVQQQSAIMEQSFKLVPQRPPAQDALMQLIENKLDAVLMTTTLPMRLTGTMIKRGARLLPIDGPIVTELMHENPFVRPARIPANTFAGYPKPIDTVGVDIVVLVRAELDEGVVYDLTRALFTSLPRLIEASPALGDIDPERSAATPIPLHPGAARHYRGSELYR